MAESCAEPLRSAPCPPALPPFMTDPLRSHRLVPRAHRDTSTERYPANSIDKGGEDVYSHVGGERRAP